MGEPAIDNLAVVILAHRDSRQLERLVTALPGCDVFVHWDVKSPALTGADLVGSLAEPRIEYLPRRDVRLASWSLVALELDAVRAALERSKAEFIGVLSGADYPLIGPDEMNESLALRQGRTWVRNVPLPHHLWHAPLLHDGGLWRWRWYFPTRNDHVFMVRKYPVFLPARRRLPVGIPLRAATHWKIYARRDAELLLRVLDDHPELVKRGRHTFTPEESFLCSVMASPELFGDRALAADKGGAWYVSWGADRGQQHPAWFGDSDIELIKKQRASFEADGAAPLTWPIFGRKFASDADGALLGRVRSELWSPTAH